MSYASLSEVAALTGAIDAADQAGVAMYLDAATAAIDRATGRHFDKVTEARSFDTAYGTRLLVGDLVSVTSITYAGYQGETPVTLTSTDYYLGPVSHPTGTKPYQWIDLSPIGDYLEYGAGYRLVVVTGVWGWPAVPGDIKMLCAELAIRKWKRAEAGVASVQDVPGLGTLTFADDWTRDELRTLALYKRLVLA
jgi:hypothetical protein